MIKTPEEVKKGLKTCSTGNLDNCRECPYFKSENCDCEMLSDALEVINGLEERIAIMSESGGRSVLGQVDNAIKAYRQETGDNPAIIIANVPAWDAMEKEAQRIAKPAPVNYATFRGIRVYKAADGYEKPRIKLARDVATYDIE